MAMAMTAMSHDLQELDLLDPPRLLSYVNGAPDLRGRFLFQESTSRELQGCVGTCGHPSSRL